jgi:glycerophosphoryl diester phosphodiesterase
MKVYGHRGASGIMPENTMMAYQKALEFGADGFELDVQRTGDGGLVIFHDDVMARTARWTVDDLVFGGIKGEPVRGHIYDYPTKVLREEIEVGSWKSPDFAGAQIPLMEEVFQWMTTNQIAINVEVKVPIDSYRSFLTIDTVRLAQQYGLTGRLIVSSFYHPALLDVKRTDPSIDCGVLSSDDLVEPGR